MVRAKGLIAHRDGDVSSWAVINCELCGWNTVRGWLPRVIGLEVTFCVGWNPLNQYLKEPLFPWGNFPSSWDHSGLGCWSPMFFLFRLVLKAASLEQTSHIGCENWPYLNKLFKFELLKWIRDDFCFDVCDIFLIWREETFLHLYLIAFF